tara:strand:+ start:11231 stop:12355 length:1125 start_codon:yes stop_codon:yes gene_type:complete
MIDCKFFYDKLQSLGLNFFTGVPDSLLKDICAYITENTIANNHIISSNEGSSIGLAIGYHLSTDKIPVVYMQNSGLGNIINPILSLADKKVYSIPMLLLIGWRGEPNVKDEPQHIKQGEITLGMLDTMEIDYEILPDKNELVEETLFRLVSNIKQNSAPAALIIKKGTFSNYQLNDNNSKFEMNREDAIKIILDNLPKDSAVVSTTGKTSREVYEFRVNNNDNKNVDFLTVGGMGHCNQIALGIAMQKPDKNIVCIDGDGAALMHLGALGIIGDISPKNFMHIVINNGSHDSVGGQPTIGFKISFSEIAKKLRYKECLTFQNHKELKNYLLKKTQFNGPVLIEVLVNKGARTDLGRPKSTPIQNKNNFKDMLNK